MSVSNERLSVPAPRRAPPRPLTEAEAATYGRVADTLCPGGPGLGPPTSHADFPAALAVAVASRADAFEVIIGLLESAANQPHLEAWLRRLWAVESDAFKVLSTVAAGAFLLLPAVRDNIGYPGQGRSLPGTDEAAEELGDGILDPVLARGHFYVEAPR